MFSAVNLFMFVCGWIETVMHSQSALVPLPVKSCTESYEMIWIKVKFSEIWDSERLHTTVNSKFLRLVREPLTRSEGFFRFSETNKQLELRKEAHVAF